MENFLASEEFRLAIDIGSIAFGLYFGLTTRNYKKVLECVISGIEIYSSKEPAPNKFVKDTILVEAKKKGMEKKVSKVAKLT